LSTVFAFTLQYELDGLITQALPFLITMTDSTPQTPQFSKPMAIFWLLRLNRTVMVAMIAGTAAFVAGASVGDSLLMTLSAWCLAVGGFSLDFFADRDLDIKGPRARTRHNPITDGSLAPSTGLVFSITFILASFILTLLIAPRALILWGIILSVIIGLALHLLEHPLTRALSLGLLQALYMLMGGIVGTLNPGIIIIAVMLFFAMFGGRGMTDIRDFPQDKETRVMTLPKRYGVKRTAYFTGICLFISFALSLGAYFTGEFTPIYLYLDIAFITVGTICAYLFMTRPSPELAYKLTLVFMMGTGTLICLAMILGSI
jgi:4-hydroxybenzoate polyprenyltransferase